MNHKRPYSIWILVLALVPIATVLWRWHRPLWDLFNNQRLLSEWVAGFGLLGPLVSIALNAAQVLLAPIPGQFVNVVNGYLYGVWMGVLYSLSGLTLGTALAMGLSRRFGRPLVERLVGAHVLARWDRLLARRGPAFFFLVFLFPLLPDDIACFIIGLSSLPIPRMLLLATLGRLPGLVFACWLGAYATLLPWWAWAMLTGTVALLAWLYLRHQERISNALLALARHLEALITRSPG
ncbi:MAG: VTT domain-containing protein [Anaerolineae bacterium]|nr:VTT domain-containing protein [Anaerolineae bacterium]